MLMDEHTNIPEDIFPAEQPIPESKGFNASGDPLIKAIGVGGGGQNAVTHMYEQKIPGVSFVIVNTDRQDLKNSSVPDQVQLGSGYGAGGIPEVARKIAEEEADKIAGIFNEDTKMVFITAGMGGGTGTGAGPVVARIAREKGKLTIGIVTIPFMFEGERKILKALDGAAELKKYVDALLMINNERLLDIYPDYDLDNAFAKADDTLTVAAQSISEMIEFNGKTNIDFKDVETTLKDGKTAIISSGYGEGENRITEALTNALNSPLLKNRDIQSSKHFLFNLYYSEEGKIKARELNEITDFMAKFSKDLELIWGRCIDNSLGNRVKITVLASGFDDVSLENESDVRRPNAGSSESNRSNTVGDAGDKANKILEEYGQEKLAEQERKRALARYVLLDPGQMDDDNIINFIERNPTFRRGNDTALREEWKSISSATRNSKDSVERKDNNTGEKVIVFGEE